MAESQIDAEVRRAGDGLMFFVFCSTKVGAESISPLLLFLDASALIGKDVDHEMPGHVKQCRFAKH